MKKLMKFMSVMASALLLCGFTHAAASDDAPVGLENARNYVRGMRAPTMTQIAQFHHGDVPARALGRKVSENGRMPASAGSEAKAYTLPVEYRPRDAGPRYRSYAACSTASGAIYPSGSNGFANCMDPAQSGMSTSPSDIARQGGARVLMIGF